MKPKPTDNQEPIDRLIDVFLEEILTGQKPPDLTARILAARRAEFDDQGAKATGAVSTPNRQAAPVVVAATPIRAGDSAKYLPAEAAIDPAKASPVNHRSPASYRDPSRNGWFAWSMSLAAMGLILAFGWYGGLEWKSWFPGNQSTTHANGDQSLSQAAPATVEAPSRPAVAGEAPPKIEIELDDLPFGPFKRQVAADSSPQPMKEQRSINRLTSEEVVAGIDQRLGELWSSLGVQPSPEQPLPQRLQQTLATLSGNSSTDAKRLGPNIESEISVERVVVHYLETGEFGRHWARLWMNQWLPATALSAPQAAGFQQWLASQINRNRPWNRVAEELLAVPLPAGNGQPSPAQAYFVSTLAGGENRSLVETIGSSFLNTKLNCVRCHDARSLPESSRGEQAEYWSLIALLKGIDAEGDLGAGQRWGIDQQDQWFANGGSPSVFYDRPDGVLVAATPLLPDGSPWQDVAADSPRIAMAKWISQSDQFSEASVNRVWELVFGRPLVPQTLNVENVSHAERAELLHFLARQFKAHDYSLSRLVQWVVSSRAFRQQPIELDRARWLNLTPAELDAYQLSELVFAAGPTLGRDRGSSLEASLANVVDWSRNPGRVETLAQPNLPTKVEPTPVVSLEPATSYLLHATRPTQAQRSFVARLLRANLRWEERVEHVVGLCEEPVDQQRVQQLARELLDQNNGDAKSALLNLLWCVQQRGAT